MTAPIILPFADLLDVKDLAPHLGQRTSPVSGSTFVDFIAAPYDSGGGPVPKMTHPNSKQTIEVSPAQVSLYAAQGWHIKPPPSKKASK